MSVLPPTPTPTSTMPTPTTTTTPTPVLPALMRLRRPDRSLANSVLGPFQS